MVRLIRLLIVCLFCFIVGNYGHEIPASILEVGHRKVPYVCSHRFSLRNKFLRNLFTRKHCQSEPLRQNNVTALHSNISPSIAEVPSSNFDFRIGFSFLAAWSSLFSFSLLYTSEFLKSEHFLLFSFGVAAFLSIPKLIGARLTQKDFLAGLELGLWQPIVAIATSQLVMENKYSLRHWIQTIGVNYLMSSVVSLGQQKASMQSWKRPALLVRGAASFGIALALWFDGSMLPNRNIIITSLLLAIYYSRARATLCRQSSPSDAATAWSLFVSAAVVSIISLYRGLLPLSSEECQDFGRDMINEPWLLPTIIIAGVLRARFSFYTEHRLLQLRQVSDMLDLKIVESIIFVMVAQILQDASK